jgi:hypothetical protein
MTLVVHRTGEHLPANPAVEVSLNRVATRHPLPGEHLCRIPHVWVRPGYRTVPGSSAIAFVTAPLSRSGQPGLKRFRNRWFRGVHDSDE